MIINFRVRKINQNIIKLFKTLTLLTKKIKLEKVSRTSTTVLTLVYSKY
jgi:hypothetical protein